MSREARAKNGKVMTPKIHIYTGLPRQIHDGLPLLRPNVISQRPPSFFTPVK